MWRTEKDSIWNWETIQSFPTKGTNMSLWPQPLLTYQGTKPHPKSGWPQSLRDTWELTSGGPSMSQSPLGRWLVLLYCSCESYLITADCWYCCLSGYVWLVSAYFCVTKKCPTFEGNIPSFWVKLTTSLSATRIAEACGDWSLLSSV